MNYLWIILTVLGVGGIFMGVRAFLNSKKEKDKKAKKLEFVIGPITLQ
jgi:hypothetical protein